MTQELIERVKTFTHQGLEILLIDYSNVKRPDEMIEILNQSVKILKSKPELKHVLTNVTDANMGGEFMGELKKTVAHFYDQRIEKAAVYGIEGVKRVLHRAVSAKKNESQNESFETREEALAWLTE